MQTQYNRKIKITLLKQRFFPVYAISFLLCSVGLLSILYSPGWLESFHWINHSLYLCIVVIGATASVFTGIILCQNGNTKEKAGSFFGPSLGLIGMGIVSLFHALDADINAVIYLHSMSLLVGGICFSLIWILRFFNNHWAGYKKNVLWLMLPGFIIIGIIPFVLPEALPIMVMDEHASWITKGICYVSSVLFIASAVNFFMYNTESDRILIVTAFLFGLSGLIFPHSILWDFHWWLWVFFQFSAYVIVTFFLINSTIEMQRKIVNSEAKFRTLFEHAGDANFVMSISPEKGASYIDCNNRASFLPEQGFHPTVRLFSRRNRPLDTLDCL